VNSNNTSEAEIFGSGQGDALATRNVMQTRVLTVLPDFPFPATTGLHLLQVSIDATPLPCEH
jgi:hypothetical protein